MNSIQALIPISSRQIWDQVNQVVKEKWFPQHEGGVRCYSSQLQALAELALGTGQFLSHKKNVVVVGGSNPSFEMLTPSFLREGLQVLNLLNQELPRTLPDAKTWVEGLPKDTAYVLFSEDHVVTAEVFFWEFLDEALNEKRIHSLRMSHHRHREDCRILKVRPFSVRICLLDLNHVVALTGSRFRTPPGLVAGMNWELNFVSQIDHLLNRQDFMLGPELVKEFEVQMGEFAFLTTTSRVYDRAVLCFREINSDRMIDHFRGRLDLIAGTNLCSWASFRMMSGWWKPSPSPEELRGLLLIPALALNDKCLINDIKQLYDKFVREQSWVIKPREKT
jgi:hypothetical protein